jgi:hypothetical protein
MNWAVGRIKPLSLVTSANKSGLSSLRGNIGGGNFASRNCQKLRVFLNPRFPYCFSGLVREVLSRIHSGKDFTELTMC